MNDERPVDLSALDPTTPPEAFEARLSAVRGAARFALLLRRERGNALFVVARWRAPLMAALFLVMIASAVVIRAAQGEAGLEADQTEEIADVVADSAATEDVLLSTSTSTTDLLLGGYEQ
jgi:hypothetical protein